MGAIYKRYQGKEALLSAVVKLTLNILEDIKVVKSSKNLEKKKGPYMYEAWDNSLGF